MTSTTITQGDTLDLLARITNDDGTYPALNTITSITLTIVSTATAQTIQTAVQVVSAVMTAGPVLNDQWLEDDVGYNLSVPAGAESLTVGNYTATINITSTDTSITTLTWSIQIKP